MPSINNVNGNDVILLNGSANTVSVTDISSITSVSIGGFPIVGASLSGNQITFGGFTIDGETPLPMLGANTLTVVSSGQTYNLPITVRVSTQYDNYTLTGVVVEEGAVGGYRDEIEVGDVIAMRTPASYGVTTNRILPAGGYIQTDVLANQTLYHQSYETGVIDSMVFDYDAPVLVPEIDSVSNNGDIRLNGGSVTFVISDYTGTINSVTLNGVVVSNLQSVNATTFTFDSPTLVAGEIPLTLGAGTLTVSSDSGSTADYGINILIPVDYASYVLTAVNDTEGSIGYYDAGAVADDIVLMRTPASLGVGTNHILTNGGAFQSDFGGEQTIWRISSEDGYAFRLDMTTPPVVVVIDEVPNSFTFASVTEASFGSVIMSDTITISELSEGVNIPVTVSGGEYSKNGGAFTAADGIVQNGDTLRLRVTSAMVAETDVIATINAGVYSTTFTVSTGAEDITPDAFTFSPTTNQFTNSNASSGTVDISGLSPGTEVPVDVSYGTYRIRRDGTWGSYIASGGTVRNGDAIQLRATSANDYLTSTIVEVNVGAYSTTWTIITRPDTSVTPFVFTAQTGLMLDSFVESNEIVVGGVSPDTAIPVTVTGGEISRFVEGSWSSWSASTNIYLNDTIKLRATTSNTYDTPTTVTVGVSGTTYTWSIRTRIDTDPDVFVFNTVNGGEIDGVYESNAVTVAGVVGGVDIPISVENCEYSIDQGGGFGPWTASPDVVRLNHVIKLRLTVTEEIMTGPNAIGNVTIGNYTTTFTVNTDIGDVEPSAFVIAPVTNATFGATVNSEIIEITDLGEELSVPVTVSIGSYSVRSGGVWTGPYNLSGGEVSNGDAIQIHVVASATPLAVVNSTVTVGSYSTVFAVTSQADTTINPVTFISQTNLPMNQWVESNEVTILGISSGTPISVSTIGCQVAKYSGGTWSAWGSTLSVSLNDTIKLRAVTANGYDTESIATIDVNGVTAQWSIRTRVDTDPDAFTFPTIGNASLNTVYESTEIILGGVVGGVDIPITVADCEYSYNDGSGFNAWTSDPGVIRLNYRVKLRLSTGGDNNASYQGSCTIGNVTRTFTVSTMAPPDTTPDDLVFAPIINAPIGGEVVSNTVTILGVSSGNDVDVTVAGGDVAVYNGSAWTPWDNQPTTVRLGYQLQVRTTSDGELGGVKIVTITVGTRTFTWVVTTRLSPDITPDPVSFIRVGDVPKGEQRESNTVVVAGIDIGAEAPYTVINGQLRKNGGGLTDSGTLQLGDTFTLVGTASNSSGAVKRVRVTIGGLQRYWEIQTVVEAVAVDDTVVTKTVENIPYEIKPVTVTGVVGKRL